MSSCQNTSSITVYCIIIPSFAVLAFAKEDNTVRLVSIKLTNSFTFLLYVSLSPQLLFCCISHFSSLYNSPRLTRAVSYSLTAASEVAEGGLEIISLYCASAFLGFVLTSFCASCILSESAGAMLMLEELERLL
jgi:hypothetical protein